MLLEGAGTPHLDTTQIGGFQPRHCIAQRGRAEPRHARLFRQPRNLARIFERRRQRLVDEQRLASGDDLAGLREVDAPVVAGEQDAIDALAELRDRGYDLDAELLLELPGE